VTLTTDLERLTVKDVGAIASDRFWGHVSKRLLYSGAVVGIIILSLLLGSFFTAGSSRYTAVIPSDRENPVTNVVVDTEDDIVTINGIIAEEVKDAIIPDYARSSMVYVAIFLLLVWGAYFIYIYNCQSRFKDTFIQKWHNGLVSGKYGKDGIPDK